MMRLGLAIIAFAFAVDVCVGLQCYECIHGSGSGGTFMEECGENFKGGSIPKVSCSGGCYKVYGKNNAGEVGILRGCDANTNETTDGCITGSNQEGEGAACICFSDLCNTGSYMTSSSFVILGLAFLLIMLRK